VNHAPIAEAGPDQVAFALPGGTASVTLNGSGSYDPDGDTIVNYLWSWVANSTVQYASGVNPTISLPVGEYTISLVVSDGALLSNPDQVTVTVIQALDSQLWLYPNQIQRGSCGSSYVIGMVRLYGISKSEVDFNQPLTIYPGGVQAYYQYGSEFVDGTVITTVVGLFDKTQLTNAIPSNGQVDLTVVGRLQSGLYFSGTDTVLFTNCQ